MNRTEKGLGKDYLDRDISWMYFNRRILQEAAKEEVPLLERLTFLGIYSNNLDEFFRVRIATLNRIIECDDKTIKKERENAIRALEEINKLNALYSAEFEQIFETIVKKLEQENIYLIDENHLSDIQQSYIQELFKEKLNGSTNPLFASSVRQLGEQSDEDIWLAIKMSQKKENRSAKNEYALIELPATEFGRFVRIPDSEGHTCLMFLDDVVRYCLPFIFVGIRYDRYEAYTFKFTKDAEMELDTDLRTGVLQKVASAVKSRKKGAPIRLVYDAEMPSDLLKRIVKMLNIDTRDTQVAGGRYHNMKDLMQFPDCGRTALKYTAWPPLFKPDLCHAGSLMDQIRTKDRYLHFPYHNFSIFIRLLREAAISKEVKSIKITLYRLAKDSKVVNTLIAAARNGKKVTVIIELLARFDETSNINWSKKMQEAGIQVIFGVEGLKIHSKLTYISSSKGNLACISTGNFHEGNAQQYTDVMLMTAKKSIVNEVKSVFDFIDKPYLPIRFKELIVSPNDMRKHFLALIDKEISNAKQGKVAWIKGKVNHITDREIVKKLYQAADAGVKTDLLVRGNCSLILDSPARRENIRINGIIDRYLEHSRIFIFANNGNERYYLGSADWMNRNFDGRIEVYTPVYDDAIRQNLKMIIDYGLRDIQQGHTVDGSGNNKPWALEEGQTPIHSQESLYQYYRNEVNAEQKN